MIGCFYDARDFKHPPYRYGDRTISFRLVSRILRVVSEGSKFFSFADSLYRQVF